MFEKSCMQTVQNMLIMHQPSITTAPTYGEGQGLCLFSLQCPAISPLPRGKLEVKTFRFALPFTIENLLWVRTSMSKLCYSPCTPDTIKSNSLAPQSSFLPHPLAVVSNDWCIIPTSFRINLMPLQKLAHAI